jgi:hypothetical protein
MPVRGVGTSDCGSKLAFHRLPAQMGRFQIVCRFFE